MASRSADPIEAEGFVLRLPEEASRSADQDEEWFEVEVDGETRRLRVHDYADIYSIPGLYERLIYDELRCESPRVVAGLLARGMERRRLDGGSLRVLDLGAGNGIVGEELARLGADHSVGVDIIPEAAEAAERDRPGLYDDYGVCDLLDGDGAARERLDRHRPNAPRCRRAPGDGAPRERLDSQRLNALTGVVALGSGHIPPEVFCESLRRAAPPSKVGYN